MALCGRSFSGGRTIVFFKTKQKAHRAKILFGLSGLPPAGQLMCFIPVQIQNTTARFEISMVDLENLSRQQFTHHDMSTYPSLIHLMVHSRAARRHDPGCPA